MKSTLVFPDGVRFARREEIPGPETDRTAEWERLQAASIHQGFVLHSAEGQRFKWYAEVNVDAPAVWALFCELCQTLLATEATLLLGGVDDEPTSVGHAETSLIISALGNHQYQLTHDGFVRFGLVSDSGGLVNEVLVAPTKHLAIWLNDESQFRLLMQRHRVPEVARLEFLDEYPRTTTKLSPGAHLIASVDDLALLLESEIGAQRQTN